MLTRSLYRKLQERIAVATSPHPQIEDESLRRNARLLASMTLALIPLHIVVSIVLYGVYGSTTWSWKLVLGSMVVTLFAYLMSRSRYASAGIDIFIAEMNIFAILLLIVNGDAYSAVTSLLPIYFASMFRSLKRLIMTAVVTIGAVFAVSRLIPGDWEQIYGVLVLLVVTSVVIVVRSHLQWQAESELHLRNQQLADSEAHFRAAIDASIGMFFLLKPVYNSNGVIQEFVLIDANTQVANRLQSEYQQLVGQPTSVVIPEVYREQFFENCRQVVEQQISINSEIRTTKGWWDYQVVPVADGAAVIGFEVTERKEFEKRRVELQIERERVVILQRFIRDISHDLMTPLSIINISTYLAGKVENQEQREIQLGKIDVQTARLKNMFDDMLVQSRLDSLAHQDLECKPVDIHHLLEKLVNSYAILAKQKSQQLTFQSRDHSAVLLADTASIEIALANLIDNGLKYTPEGGTIMVSSEISQQEISIVVEDNGIGIPLNELPLVFERFYRVEAHRPLTAGTGLGLSITKKIIELHGGSIMAENRAEGGMRFSVYLRRG